MLKMSGNTQKYIALGLMSNMKEASVQVNFSNSVYTKWCLKIIFEVMIIEEKLYTVWIDLLNVTNIMTHIFFMIYLVADSHTMTIFMVN